MTTLTMTPRAQSSQPVYTKLQNPNMSVRKFIKVPTVLSPEHSCREVVQMISRGIEGECMVICCDERKIPMGLLMKDRFYRFLGKKYGADLYYDKPIHKLMDAEPLIVDIGLSPQEMIDLALNRTDEQFYDCVIVTENQRFLGILTVGILLKMSRMLQQNAIQTQLRTAHGTEEMIELIHTSMQQMTASSNEGIKQSELMVDLTLQGKTELDKVSCAFGGISDKATQQEKQIVELQQKTGSVTNISQFIRDLAEQTNLLAVNATIEAARAGEHGKGFAVVATEVRNLADQTKRSAEEISAMIEQIDAAVRRTVKLVQDGKAETVGSAAYVEEATALFQKLFHSAVDNRKQVQEIYQHAAVADRKTLEVKQAVANIMSQMEKIV